MSLLKVAGTTASSGQLYVNDVFSVYLYTGNGSTQTITNGIDLAGKGGLVWIKGRTDSINTHVLQDTINGNNYLSSDTTNPAQINYNNVTAFNSAGFSIGAASRVNSGGVNFASWTFRKAAKFFDVVTYTGTGGVQNIAHNLGSVPAMIIVKRTDSSTNWAVYHRSLGNNGSLILNDTAAADAYSSLWNSTTPTTTQFTVNSGNAQVGGTGGTCVAYLYAHDTSSTGIIQCGSVTIPSSGTIDVNLGYEPQYLLLKSSNIADNWWIFDTMRGWTVGTVENTLYANTSAAETTWASPGLTINPTATGFNIGQDFGANYQYIYMAIRMPNKPPTTGTQVFQPIIDTGDLVETSTATFPLDMQFNAFYNQSNATYNNQINDRLRGIGFAPSFTTTPHLTTASTGAETTSSSYLAFKGNGMDVTKSDGWGTGYSAVFYNFKRAPGFFDEVCYTGTGVGNRTVAHNLAAIPEIMIVKGRGNTFGWAVYVQSLGNNDALYLNETSGSPGSPQWNTTNPTATQFTLGGGNVVNGSTLPYVAYLFATLAGISKVGSYTGNGTGQAIACGFSTGARFVLIKRTDAAGNWYTFDSARGLTVGSSPYLLLNSTAAEVTGNNGVYASTGGFTLDATAITTTNILGASYIYLSVA